MSVNPLPTDSDRTAVRDLFAAYAFGLDLRNFARVASVFTDDAPVENIFDSYMPEGEGFHSVTIGGLAVADGARQLFSALDATQHFIGTQDVEFTSTGASVMTQMVAHHHRGTGYYHTGGTYEDDLVRTAEGWRISKRTVRIHWTLGSPDVFVPVAGGAGADENV